MSLPSLSFSEAVDNMVASWSASLGFQPTLQPGDSMYALMQSVSSQLMFIQYLITLVNAVARAQTSEGADLDSFYAQFGFTRLPASYASGSETLSMASPAGGNILIGVGAVVQTPGGAIQYQIVADASQPTWSATQNGYIMATGQTSLTATVQALVAGSASNVGPGALTQIASSLQVASATNGAAISNGIDAERDDAFRSRFVLFLNSLSKAIKAAIESAIAGVQQGVLVNLLENENSLGVSAPGQFTAVIDDGSGAPPSSLITAVQNALEPVRAFTVLANVVAVVEVSVTVSLACRLATGYTLTGVNPLESAIQDAVAAYVNTTPGGGIDGVLVYISGITTAANSVTGVVSVQPGTVLINGVANDLAGTAFQVAKTTVSAVTVGSY